LSMARGFIDTQQTRAQLVSFLVWHESPGVGKCMFMCVFVCVWQFDRLVREERPKFAEDMLVPYDGSLGEPRRRCRYHWYQCCATMV
jgi:hypothetical protein